MKRRGPRKPDKALAVMLAVAVHAGLALFLIFGVRWQNQSPEPMMVELVPPIAPVKPAIHKPEPRPQPKAEPKPEPKPEPPPPEPPPPKPEPKPEPPPVPKADIALKQKQEKERVDKQRIEQERIDKQRIETERVQREAQEKAKQDRLAREREMREMAKIESDKRERELKELARREADKRALAETRLAQERAQAEAEDRRRREELTRAEREQRAQRERLEAAENAAKSAASRAVTDYVNRIQAKIKGNVILPPEVTGNPEAVFEVVQLPTGEIISAELRKSSGSRAYDEAVSRAIVKSSPLPKPDQADLFQRVLRLRFRPQS